MVNEDEEVQYFVQRAKELETSCPYQARTFLIVGKALHHTNFYIYHETYLFEKRQRNEYLAAKAFESMFREFMTNLDVEIREMANAIQAIHLNKEKGTDDQLFLLKIFAACAKDVQIEVLMRRSEQPDASVFEKCQCMLLLVKLYPDVLTQHGGKLLDSVLMVDADAFTTFRKLLVTELIPAVLLLGEGIEGSGSGQPLPQRVATLLNRCIEYYVLVSPESDSTAGTGTEDILEIDAKRWTQLYDIVDKVGLIMHWRISPFFANALQNSSAANVENLYQGLYNALQQRHLYDVPELAYIAVILFLRCIVTYDNLAYCTTKYGEKSRLELVEIFLPRPYRTSKPDPTLPVLITASPCASLEGRQSTLLHSFLTASKIWEMFATATQGDRIEKEFFNILCALINLEKWTVFQSFLIDFRTYSGQYYQQDAHNLRSPVKLASLHCAEDDLKSAVECAITAVQNALQQESTNTPEVSPSHENRLNNNKPEDFSFFNSHVYSLDSKKNFILQRRVHFLSSNRSEIISYAANILIRAFHETIEVPPRGKEDLCLGHLLTILQLEWPSSPAVLIFERILEIIRLNGSFRYFPFFGDFILNDDYLEQFMAIANHEPQISLEFWQPTNIAVATGSRRRATRGVGKGAKNEFQDSMTKQMMKNGVENLENLIIKFLTLNKADILACFSG